MASTRQIFELGLNAGLSTAESSIVWTDFSSLVVKYYQEQGRDRAINRMEAGTIKVVANNKDRRFDPLNTSSPYYPNLKLRRRMRRRTEFPWLPGLQYNPNFDFGTVGWTVTSATLATTAGAYYSSTGSANLAARVTATGAGLTTLLPTAAQYIEVTPGELLTITARAKRGALVSGSDRNSYIQVIFYQSDKTTVVSTVGSTTGVQNTTSFARRELAGSTVPALAAYAAVALRTAAGVSGDATDWSTVVVEKTPVVLDKTKFYGYLDSIPQQIDGFNGLYVGMEATDGFARMATIDLKKSFYEYTINLAANKPSTLYRFAEPPGTTNVVETFDPFSNVGVYGSRVEKVQSEINGEDVSAMRRLDAGYNYATNVAATIPGGAIAPYGSEVFSVMAIFNGDENGPGDFSVFWDVPTTSITDHTMNFTMTGTVNAGTGMIDWAFFTTHYHTDGNISILQSTWSEPITRAAIIGPHSVIYTKNGTTKALYFDGVARTVTGTLYAADLIGPVGDMRFAMGTATADVRPGFDEFAIWRGTAISSTVAANIHASLILPLAGQKTGARITSLLDIGEWPADLRSISTGISTLQEILMFQSLLEAVQQAASSENGAAYMLGSGVLKFRDRHELLKAPYNTVQFTFGAPPSGTELPYESFEPDYDIQRVVNLVHSGRRGGQIFETRKQSSIDEYGHQDHEKTDLEVQSDNEAVSYAQWVLESGEPDLIINSIKIKPMGDAPLHVAANTIFLEDLLRVIRRYSAGGTNFDRNLRVQKIIESGDGNDWQLEYWLDSNSVKQYMILDDPVLGLLDGTNMLAY
jgi:hypothetical protein